MDPALSRNGAVLPSSTPTGVIDLTCFPSPEKRSPPFLPEQEALSSNTSRNEHPSLPAEKFKLAQRKRKENATRLPPLASPNPNPPRKRRRRSPSRSSPKLPRRDGSPTRRQIILDLSNDNDSPTSEKIKLVPKNRKENVTRSPLASLNPNTPEQKRKRQSSPSRNSPSPKRPHRDTPARQQIFVLDDDSPDRSSNCPTTQLAAQLAFVCKKKDQEFQEEKARAPPEDSLSRCASTLKGLARQYRQDTRLCFQCLRLAKQC